MIFKLLSIFLSRTGIAHVFVMSSTDLLIKKSLINKNAYIKLLPCDFKRTEKAFSTIFQLSLVSVSIKQKAQGSGGALVKILIWMLVSFLWVMIVMGDDSVIFLRFKIWDCHFFGLTFWAFQFVWVQASL